MNRQGMLVDISHASDRTFMRLDVSRRSVESLPLLRTGNSDNARNMSDDMIRALAARAG